jgi:hypothetical protein
VNDRTLFPDCFPIVCVYRHFPEGCALQRHDGSKTPLRATPKD